MKKNANSIIVLASFNSIECDQNNLELFKLNYEVKCALLNSKSYDILEKVISIIYKFQNLESQHFYLTHVIKLLHFVDIEC